MSTVSTALPLEAQCTHRAPLRPESRRRMTVALEIAAAIMVVELVGGWLAGSLALLADAGHMLADVGALALSLVVASLAQRPVHQRRQDLEPEQAECALGGGGALREGGDH